MVLLDLPQWTWEVIGSRGPRRTSAISFMPTLPPWLSLAGVELHNSVLIRLSGAPACAERPVRRSNWPRSMRARTRARGRSTSSSSSTARRWWRSAVVRSPAVSARQARPFAATERGHRHGHRAFTLSKWSMSVRVSSWRRVRRNAVIAVSAHGMTHGSIRPALSRARSGGFRTPVPIESVHPFRSFRTPWTGGPCSAGVR